MTSKSGRGAPTNTGSVTSADAAERPGHPILFDMDGVVLRGRGTASWVYDRASDRAIETLDLAVTPDQRVRLRNYDVNDVVDVCSSFDVDPERFWRLREEYATAIANERIETGERALHDDVTALDRLSEERPLALVSNNRHGTVTFVAQHFDLPFDAVRGRDPTLAGFRRRKPKPDYLLETLADLERDGGIYVGDRQTDVRAAERAGLEAVYLRRTHNEDEPLPPASSHELESLADVVSILE